MREDHKRNNPLTQEDTRLKNFSRDFLKETHHYCNEYLYEYFSSSKRCIPKTNRIFLRRYRDVFRVHITYTICKN